MVGFFKKLVVVSIALLLSACVTQNFEKDSPVVENNASNNELAMTRISLGLGYLKMGNNSQAKFNLEKAKKFAPNLVEVYAAFAHYYETVEEPTLAVESYEKALSINSLDANTLNNYGVFLCRQEKFEASEKQFLKAIKVPSYLLVSESYENLASCQIDAGKFEKAQMYLGKAIAHSPNRSSALLQMVRLEYAMGNYKKARLYGQKFEKATRRFKPESLALSVKVYKRLGDHKIARNYGAMLVKMYPESWESKQYVLNGLQRIEADELADKYQEIQAKNEAKKPKKRVVLLSPKNRVNTDVVESKVQNSDEALLSTNTSTKQSNSTSKVSDAAATATSVATVTAAAVVSPLIKEPEEPIAKDHVAEEPIFDETPTEEILAAEHIDQEKVSEEVLSEEVPSEEIVADVDEKALVVEEPIDVMTEQLASVSVEKDLTENVMMDSDANDASLVNETHLVDTDISENNIAAYSDVIDDDKITNEDELIGEKFSEDITAVEKVETPYHVVVKGDNLFLISVKYNIQMKAIKRWNDMGESSSIKIGDKIFIEEPKAELNADD